MFLSLEDKNQWPKKPSVMNIVVLNLIKVWNEIKTQFEALHDSTTLHFKYS